MRLDVLELILGKMPEGTMDDVFSVVNAICLASAAVGWEGIISNFAKRKE